MGEINVRIFYDPYLVPYYGYHGYDTLPNLEDLPEDLENPLEKSFDIFKHSRSLRNRRKEVSKLATKLEKEWKQKTSNRRRKVSKLAEEIKKKDYTVIIPEDEPSVIVEQDSRTRFLIDAFCPRYWKEMQEKDFSFDELVGSVKEGSEFLKNLPLDVEYENRIALVVDGYNFDIKNFYQRNKDVIQNFGEKLYKDPVFSLRMNEDKKFNRGELRVTISPSNKLRFRWDD